MKTLLEYAPCVHIKLYLVPMRPSAIFEQSGRFKDQSNVIYFMHSIPVFTDIKSDFFSALRVKSVHNIHAILSIYQQRVVLKDATKISYLFSPIG